MIITCETFSKSINMVNLCNRKTKDYIFFNYFNAFASVTLKCLKHWPLTCEISEFYQIEMICTYYCGFRKCQAILLVQTLILFVAFFNQMPLPQSMPDFEYPKRLFRTLFNFTSRHKLKLSRVWQSIKT